MVQSLQFFRRIMLLLNVTVGAFLVWVFGMTPVLAARQSSFAGSEVGRRSVRTEFERAAG